MNITDLFPLGRREAGCAQLQTPDGARVRVVYWSEGAPGAWNNYTAVSISNITEQTFTVDELDMPEPLARAFGLVLDEILSNPRTAQEGAWTPGSFRRAVERARSASGLKAAVTVDDYARALRAKSRLGIWL